jgi:hypothetical protein
MFAEFSLWFGCFLFCLLYFMFLSHVGLGSFFFFFGQTYRKRFRLSFWNPRDKIFRISEFSFQFWWCLYKCARFQLSTSSRIGLVFKQRKKEILHPPFRTSREKFSGFRIFSFDLDCPSISLPNFGSLPYIEMG